MPKSREQKAKIKDNLVENFKNSTSVVFADYQGMSVPQADELRKKMYEGNVKYMVAKKTLINLAAKEAGVTMDAKTLPGMIGVAFAAEDEIAPAKILGDMTKDTSLKLVGGIFGGNAVDQNYVVALSKLPSRTQLYGMFVSVINGPVSAFVRALDAIRKQKEEGSPDKSEVRGPESANQAEEKPAETPAAPDAPAAETPAPAPAEEAKVEETPAPAAEAPKE